MKNIHRPYGTYERFFKRPLDFVLSLIAIICLSPIIGITALLVRIKLGSPVLFCQERPGRNEKIFKIYKFRTMTDAKNENGKLLPDEVRLTKFGKMLRATSLDELPELFNILKGDMSIIGPRPQLVRDMLFMTEQQRLRHIVTPGLTGLAQVNGRNNISWEDKLNYDIEYINNITFKNDVSILLKTIWTALIKRQDIETEGMATAEDLGDYLLRVGTVNQDEYDRLNTAAKNILL